VKFLRVFSWIGSVAAMAMFWNVVFESGEALHSKGAIWEALKLLGSIVLILAIATAYAYNVVNEDWDK